VEDKTIKQTRTTRLGPYKTLVGQMDDDYNTWRPHFLKLAESFMPRRGRYLQSPNADNMARKSFTNRDDILNGTPEYVARVVAAGLQSGSTSPSYPWFELTLDDPDLAAFGPVHEWLFTVRNIMLNAFARSNFYASTYSQYMELPTFGVACMMIEEDFQSGIRCRPYTIGEYMLGYDENYRVMTKVRKFQMTATMLTNEFGEENVSRSVRDAMSSYKGEDRFEVVHVIQPNTRYSPGRDDVAGKKFESVYYQPDQENNDEFLRIGGYRTKPFTSPRWDVVGIDVVGDGIGSMALGDAQMLQKEEETKLKLLEKQADPPMNATPDLKRKGGTILPGGINFFASTQGSTGFTPSYQVSPDYQAIAHEIGTVMDRIKTFYFYDLFLSVLGNDKSRQTATEIIEGHEEKLHLLGPVLNRIHDEQHDPTIQRTYDLLDDFNAFPEPPSELEGQNLKIVYISVLAQAQKRVEVDSIERTAAFIERQVMVDPKARYKYNTYGAIDKYSHYTNIPPGIINSNEVADELMAADVQAQQAEQAKEDLAGMASGAKDLSQAQTKDGNLLDKVIEQTGL